MGAIAGGVVGGVFLLLLVCGGIVFAIRRRRRRIPKSSPEKADSTWNSVNESAKDVDLAAPGDSLSLPDPVVTSTPLDAIAEKHPVATSGPVQVVASEDTGNDVRDAIFVSVYRCFLSYWTSESSFTPRSDTLGLMQLKWREVLKRGPLMFLTNTPRISNPFPNWRQRWYVYQNLRSQVQLLSPSTGSTLATMIENPLL